MSGPAIGSALYTTFGFGISFGTVGVWILLIAFLIHAFMPNDAAQESPEDSTECHTNEKLGNSEDPGTQSTELLTTKIVLKVSCQSQIHKCQ